MTYKELLEQLKDKDGEVTLDDVTAVFRTNAPEEKNENTAEAAPASDPSDKEQSNSNKLENDTNRKATDYVTMADLLRLVESLKAAPDVEKEEVNNAEIYI